MTSVLPEAESWRSGAMDQFLPQAGTTRYNRMVKAQSQKRILPRVDALIAQTSRNPQRQHYKFKGNNKYPRLEPSNTRQSIFQSKRQVSYLKY